MRALWMTEPSATSDHSGVAEVPEPRPEGSQVSIDVAYAGVNFIDVMARRGDPGYASAWPFVPGLEVAGTIREVGRDVIGFSIGQRVAAFTFGGGLAELAVAEANLVVPLPEEVQLLAAASAPLMLSTALLLLTDVARIQPGETVLMHSASGGVGTAIAQLVPILGGGLRIGTVGRIEKVAEARRAGWDVALCRDEDLAAAILQQAVAGVDIVLDPSGTSLLEIDLAVAAPGARVVVFGNAGGLAVASLPSVGRLIGGNVAVAGFSISRLAATAPARVTSALTRVLQLLAGGRLQMPVAEVDTLEAVPAVHDLLASGRGGGKYVARVGS